MRSRLLAWAPALAWAALIFAVSARPTLPVRMETGLDKVAHLAAYAVLGAALLHATQARVSAAALGWLYGLSDEIHQSFVPGRDADPADWVADAVGVLVGLFLYHQLRRWAAPGEPSAGAVAEPPPT